MQNDEIINNHTDDFIPESEPIPMPETPDMEEILERAYLAHRNHTRGIRGQTITNADRIEYWVAHETIQWARNAVMSGRSITSP